MIFTPLPLEGAFLIGIEPISDERGFFARSWCREEFSRHGLQANIEQCNISFNAQRGTLRGLHFQIEPYAEAKLVRCIRGRIFDVIVDLRPASPTYRHWHAEELDAENRSAMYVPKGLAHGFQTLIDDSEVMYQMTEPYHPESSRGVRWDSPWLRIDWPINHPIVISERDRSFPDHP
jgi:dTDP-4-dehydrorhamnose 3,5-epimerase